MGESRDARRRPADGEDADARLGRGVVAPGSALLCADYEKPLRRLPALSGAGAAALLAKLDEAASLSRTNVSPGLVADLVRMALTRAAGLTKSA